MGLEINALDPSTVWQVPETFRAVYTHAMRIRKGTEMLFMSGQFGMRPDGTLPADFPAQAEQALANVEALLGAAGMGLDNVVKLTYLLTRADDAAELVKLRARKWAGRQAPAVTVMTVVALAKPEYLVEIEAIAVA